MSRYQVIWTKRWEGPILPVDKCPHSGPDALTINQRLDPAKRGRHQIAMDASICMRCGADSTGNLSLAAGLAACMDEHGWNAAAGDRLYDLAARHEEALLQEDSVPIWAFYAFGWTGKQLVDALNAGQLKPAAAA